MAPLNKYNLAGRVAEVEVVASSALSEVKRAHARLDVQPPRGETGATGPMGLPGKDATCCCRNGRDSTVAGPAGATGQTGARGVDGKDGRNAPSLDELLAASRQDCETVRAELREIKLMLDGFLALNSKAASYILWLKERTAATLKGKS
jgi:hypothetical protein